MIILNIIPSSRHYYLTIISPLNYLTSISRPGAASIHQYLTSIISPVSHGLVPPVFTSLTVTSIISPLSHHYLAVSHHSPLFAPLLIINYLTVVSPVSHRIFHQYLAVVSPISPLSRQHSVSHRHFTSISPWSRLFHRTVILSRQYLTTISPDQLSW